MPKRYLGKNVHDAACERIAWVFDRFEKVVVAFSGGKDSTVLLHLVADEAQRRSRKVTAAFIDWEAQYRLTIEHVQACFYEYADCVEPLWICLPLRTVNACSVFEPEWTCWDPDKRDLWVRPMPDGCVSSTAAFSFYEPNMTFEHFVAAFGRSLGPSAQVLGLRCDESITRRISVMRDFKTYDGAKWTTETVPGVIKATPLYDWTVRDIWTYHARSGKRHNKLYDLFHQAGVSLHQMRVCEPFGNEQRRGLQMVHAIEPDTWRRIVDRVAGVNAAALYAKQRGNITGNRLITLPNGHTWKSYAVFLLDTMPARTREHYQNKIAVYLKWYADHDVPDLPDEAEGDLGPKDSGSWRRICKVLLKNDYWCMALNFSPQKSAAYERYRQIMQRRRNEWRIFAD